MEKNSRDLIQLPITNQKKNCLWNLKKGLHRPGIEPGPPAWQASILPLNQRCSQEEFYQKVFAFEIFFDSERSEGPWKWKDTRDHKMFCRQHWHCRLSICSYFDWVWRQCPTNYSDTVRRRALSKVLSPKRYPCAINVEKGHKRRRKNSWTFWYSLKFSRLEDFLLKLKWQKEDSKGHLGHLQIIPIL